MEERGAYITLLCHSWIEGFIPNDIKKLSILCNVTEEKMAQLWLAISPCFKNGKKNNKLFNPRLKKERKKQIDFNKERIKSGKKGAKIRWEKGDSSAIEQPMAKNGSSSSSSSSTANKPLKHIDDKTELETEFEEFWTGYRIMGNSKDAIGDKQAAKKAYKSLRGKISKEELLKAFHGEADYLKYEKINNNFDKRKKYASTWLRSGWETHMDFKYKARL